MIKLDDIKRGDKLKIKAKDNGWDSVTYYPVIYVNYSDREILIEDYGEIVILHERAFNLLKFEHTKK